MHKKNNIFNLGSILILLIVAAIGSIGWYISQPQSKALASNTNNQQPLLNQKELLSKPTPQLTSSLPQSQTVNGVTIELTSVKVTETGIQIGVCYPTPDGGDWYPTAGNLSYSTNEIPPDEFEFVSEQKADGVNKGKRCVLIRYRIDEIGSITTPMQFTLTDYWAVPRELPPCENLQQRLNTSPKAKAYGLKAQCSYDEQSGMSVTLSDKASTVAQDKAQQVLNEIVRGQVDGPWEFTITQIEK